MMQRKWTNPVFATLATLVFLGGATAAVAAPAAPKAGTISFAKAESIALARVPGGQVEEIDRDRDGGRLVYEVDVRAPDGREHDITIDAQDGRVISDEIED